MSARARHVFMVVTVAATFVATNARAQSKAECIATFDQAQDLREASKLVEARDRLKACSVDACPAALRKDCAQLLDEVSRDIPTVIVGARGTDGQDLRDVRVLVDGAPLANVRPGASVPLDPGSHVFRYEREGYAFGQKELVLHMGERNRDAVVVLEIVKGGNGSAAPSGDAEASGHPRGDRVPSRSVLPWVLGGVGVAALGGFTFFAVTGKNEKDRVASRCAPDCTDAEVSGVRGRYIAADVSLAVGIVALGVATVLFIDEARASR